MTRSSIAAKCSAKIIEYMAMGLPIVASRVGQNVEYIEHGASGLLAEPGDADSFAQMMLAVLSDPQKAKAMGAGGARARVGQIRLGQAGGDGGAGVSRCKRQVGRMQEAGNKAQVAGRAFGRWVVGRSCGWG